MEHLSTVLLRPGEADRVVAGHPWIYQGSIQRLTQPVADGDVVQVKDHRQRFLGLGFFNSKSKIHVRMLASERVTIDETFFEGRIREAWAVRQRHLPDATSCRIVNAESDFLSGLIVDKYEDVLVLQTSALGMDRRKAMLVGVLQKVFSPRAIVERNDIASRKFEGLAEANGILAGSLGPGIEATGADSDSPRIEHRLTAPGPEGVIQARINGLAFEVDLLGGHKTGLYLDQQVNYRFVAELAKGALVLDCFSFLGGFALHAARAEAVQVHALDQSPEAVASAKRNAARNGLEARCSFEVANVFDWLKAHTTTRAHEKLIPQFDLVVLDPPSFTRNRAAIPDAMRGYKEIHLRALKLLKPGGTLATFCCSHHVSAAMFQEVIVAAAADARRALRRTAIYSQSPDHPVLPTIPETEYLKGYAFELVR
jgi:23S rRNA (cytosine1962-C5)-methyltransferase